MPRDFKNFVKNNEQVLNDNKDKVNEYQNIINKYKDMNQSDLMSNLFNEASKLKQDGKLNTDMLNNLKSTLSPFLNTDQQNMLNEIIGKIDEQK